MAHSEDDLSTIDRRCKLPYAAVRHRAVSTYVPTFLADSPLIMSIPWRLTSSQSRKTGSLDKQLPPGAMTAEANAVIVPVKVLCHWTSHRNLPPPP